MLKASKESFFASLPVFSFFSFFYSYFESTESSSESGFYSDYFSLYFVFSGIFAFGEVVRLIGLASGRANILSRKSLAGLMGLKPIFS